METTTRYALERHDGPYERWPQRSRLLIDGAPAAVRIPGYKLLHQYALPSGYLLVTDFDCPFEEATSFVLLDRNSRLLCCRTLAVPYGSYILDKMAWIDDRHARISFQGDDHWSLTIRDRGIPLLHPRLRLGRLGAAP